MYLPDTARPKAFWTARTIELHMLEPDDKPTAKTRAFRIFRTPATDKMVAAMVEAAEAATRAEEAL